MARIVIVDDDELLAEIAMEALSDAGHLVSAVHHGDEALPALEDSQPDLVILDYILPGRTGLQILRDIRKRAANSALPVMMVSSRGGRILVGRAMQDGADDYMTKPIDTAILVERVEALLRGSQMARMAMGAHCALSFARPGKGTGRPSQG